MSTFSLENFLKSQVGDDSARFPVLDFRELEQTDSLAERSDLEWLATNGLGSYASQTVTNANTRRYHGLFVLAHQPPVQRRVLLARLDEIVESGDGNNIELATCYWRDGAVAPHGYERLKAFAHLPVPTWQYEIPGGVLIKQVMLVHDEQRVLIGYTWQPDPGGPQEISMKVAVLATDRDFHGETQGRKDWKFEQHLFANAVSIQAHDDAIKWFLQYSSGAYREQPDWYWGYNWPAEWERGLADCEDLYRTGAVETSLSAGKTFLLAACLENTGSQPDMTEAVRNEWSRLQELISQARAEGQVAEQLLIASDQFVVRRSSTESESIIAGYHWFSDWGRDAMISLPGLLIETGRHQEARSVLSTFGKNMKNGMLPNYFPDAGQTPEYNTMDATLWWAFALDEYYRNTGDLPFLLEQVPLLDKVVIAHLQGTEYGIKVDP
ncbi:MAG: glycogen debranching enzyme N-terminal domain-containing protein, partial [Candidatus Melainabacteria bacterium]|nr:glycogen debranching enzyme N-terminal domain-containing protein [Candidatus Melainabacteria bacterium]